MYVALFKSTTNQKTMSHIADVIFKR